jgi:hypothetical protein
MEVDHVIPEALLDLSSNPKRPRNTRVDPKQLWLPLDFDLQSFANWLPSCCPCNDRKRSRVFNPTPRIQLDLQIATEKAPMAPELAASRVAEQALSEAWNTIKRADLVERNGWRQNCQGPLRGWGRSGSPTH